jgi:hypothetical protein
MPPANSGLSNSALKFSTDATDGDDSDMPEPEEAATMLNLNGQKRCYIAAD